VVLNAPDITDLAQIEAQWAALSVSKVAVDAVIPAASVLKQIADSTLVEGAVMSDWFKKLESTVAFDIERSVKIGVALGETNDQIARRIIGAVGDKGPEIIPRAKRDAKAIVRTTIQTISNKARLKTYEENADLIKAVQWVSVLDNRTSDICMARAGLTWSFPDYKPIKHKIPFLNGPPAHWACRSTVIPILKSWRDLGVDFDELPESTRSSMDGQVAASTTFDQFLKGKPASFADEMLGKGRADLWRQGKITLSQLLNSKGKPITRAELRRRYSAEP
jgi:SPP1 gp7 family putative phage head morphogenesis protein